MITLQRVNIQLGQRLTRKEVLFSHCINCCCRFLSSCPQSDGAYQAAAMVHVQEQPWKGGLWQFAVPDLPGPHKGYDFFAGAGPCCKA